MDAITVEDLRGYIGTGESALERDLEDVLGAAKALVGIHTKGKTVPEIIIKQAVLECGSKIYQRRFAPTNEYGDGTGHMILAPRDPMVTAYPILAPFVGISL